MDFAPLGDRAVLITLGSAIDDATHRRVRAVTARIATGDARGELPGITDLVPAFASVAVHYDPMAFAAHPGGPYAAIVERLDAALSGLRVDALPQPKVVEIPVCYGGAFGPDLEDVARCHELTAADVVKLHTAGDYLVYMVGFMPGFAYLGGLTPQLATPRRSVPRTAVPAGTVGIGGQQTGVYPLESPGGWHLIGRTPLKIFDLEREEATLLATGDRVRFRAISADEFHAWPAAHA